MAIPADVTYAPCGIRCEPGFAIVATLIVALGIGALTAA